MSEELIYFNGMDSSTANKVNWRTHRPAGGRRPAPKGAPREDMSHNLSVLGGVHHNAVQRGGINDERTSIYHG